MGEQVLPWSIYIPKVCGLVWKSSNTGHARVMSTFASLKFTPILRPGPNQHPALRGLELPPTPDSMDANLFASLLHPGPEPGDVTKPSKLSFRDLAMLMASDEQAFENTSTSVAASQMRNALNNLADTVSDAEQKKVQSQIHPLAHRLALTVPSSLRPKWTTFLLSSGAI